MLLVVHHIETTCVWTVRFVFLTDFLPEGFKTERSLRQTSMYTVKACIKNKMQGATATGGNLHATISSNKAILYKFLVLGLLHMGARKALVGMSSVRRSLRKIALPAQDRHAAA